MKARNIIAAIAAACLILPGCAPSSNPSATTPSDQASSSQPSDSSEHRHVPPALRIADNFVVECETLPMCSQYYVSYKEPDGCLTRVLCMGYNKQDMMIHDKLIYYSEAGTIYADDFTGKCVYQYRLESPISDALLVCCDDQYIYGAGGNLDGDAEYCFAIDHTLKEYHPLPAIPARYRQMDYEMLLQDFARAAQCEPDEMYVHQAWVTYDFNGRLKKITLALSIQHDGETRCGNLFWSWYNQEKTYRQAALNPYFGTVSQAYEELSNAMPIGTFLNYLQIMEKDDLLPTLLTEKNDFYQLLFQWSLDDSESGYPMQPDAPSDYVSLSSSGYKRIAKPEQLPNFYFKAKSLQYDPTSDRNIHPTVSALLYILPDIP